MNLEEHIDHINQKLQADYAAKYTFAEVSHLLEVVIVLEKHSPQNSPPLEGCPQGGVVRSERPQGVEVYSESRSDEHRPNLPQGDEVPTNLPQGDEVHSHLPRSDEVPTNLPQGDEVHSHLPQDDSFLSKLQTKQLVITINNIPIYRNFVVNLPHNPKLAQLAKDKRKEGILSEVLFWQQVHKGVFHKIDFDRQRIIGNYIVDFYVKTLGLVVEIDGKSHDSKVEYDAKRQAYLESFGLKVYRIKDIDVKKNLVSVMNALENYIIQEYGTPDFDCVIDYFFAVLHSSTYREKYKEFFKTDFPKVPYPKDKTTFWQLAKLGNEIRQTHLSETDRLIKEIDKIEIE